MNKITKLVQQFHDDGMSDDEAIDTSVAYLLYDACDEYELSYPDDSQITKIADAMRDLVKESVDWEEIEADDENAKEWEEAKRSALYR